jgi:hypothetical protein
MTRSVPTIAATAGLAEDDSRPLVWVVVVDRHVRRAGEQDAGDRDVEVGGPRRDAHPDPVATPDTVAAQRRRELLGGVEQFVVGQDLTAVVDRRGVGMCIGGGAQDVDEGARLRSERPPQVCRGEGRGTRGVLWHWAFGEVGSIGRMPRRVGHRGLLARGIRGRRGMATMLRPDALPGAVWSAARGWG